MILDILIVADVNGMIYLIENTFYHTLKNNLKVSILSDVKQPFFSIGLSQSNKQSEMAKLTKEQHVIEEKAKSEKSKPFFSFGFFRKKTTEPKSEPSTPSREEKKLFEDKPEVSTKSEPDNSTSKRVQINKSEILSGNYSFKSGANKPSAIKKPTVNQDRIDEVLRRIERHTTKPKETTNEEVKDNVDSVAKESKDPEPEPKPEIK